MISLHKPILIVIAGPNGSGKTTITSKLLRSEWLEDAVYINPDNVALEKFGDWNSPVHYSALRMVKSENYTLITLPHGPGIFYRNHKNNFMNPSRYLQQLFLQLERLVGRGMIESTNAIKFQ